LLYNTVLLEDNKKTVHSEDTLKQIPENWLALIEKSEIDQEKAIVRDELMALTGKRLNLHNRSDDEIVEEAAKSWNMSSAEFEDSLQSLVELRTTTRLFVRHYGHLFPKDESGNPVLRPEEIARIHGKTEEEVLEAIYVNREDLKAKGLLHEWPVNKNKRLH